MNQSTRACRVCGIVKPENGVGDRPTMCRDCYNAHRRAKRSETAPHLTCPVCTTSFKRVHGGDKFCSERCFSESRRVRKGLDPLRDRLCVECGEEFRPKRGHSRVCSLQCFNKERYRRRLQNPAFVAYRQQYGPAYYQANRTQILEAGRVWRDMNREKHRESCRKWYQANRERSLIAGREWARANPVKRTQTEHRRRARRAGTQVERITPEKLASKSLFWSNRCWMCGCSNPDTWDHVKPLSKGGPHILANLRPACRTCNSSKHAQWAGPRRIRALAT